MVFKNIVLSLIIGVSAVLMSSCTKDEPSVLKIFVRSQANILTPNAQVRIVGDVDKDTPEYLEEKKTNESGVAIFELDELFDQYGKNDDKIAYFTVYAKDTAEFFTLGTARAKQYLTSTETIIINE
ncbi:hypothetical protein [Brumimicrobium oceani]|uniref:DUF4369 domain-containing protein n=1 Tax=Brumimicrobium oceani TaxID=2100725 RepID=A0A2U2XCV8_9FLAO|nr:hypothetical protein [Brumimicrobium oceani]PWH85603.1 hypothetical protein DIT68_08165 [Brumimicrobium oceani]